MWFRTYFDKMINKWLESGLSPEFHGEDQASVIVPICGRSENTVIHTIDRGTDSLRISPNPDDFLAILEPFISLPMTREVVNEVTIMVEDYRREYEDYVSKTPWHEYDRFPDLKIDSFSGCVEVGYNE